MPRGAHMALLPLVGLFCRALLLSAVLSRGGLGEHMALLASVGLFYC